jgi:uncharacterized membrane-anchored protein
VIPTLARPRSALFAAVAVILTAVAYGQAEEAAEEPNPLDELDWKFGPTQQPVGANATIKVPDGYVFLDAPNTSKYMELLQNPANGREYTIAPSTLDWFAVFEFDESGYVKDDDQIEADALLASLKSATEASNEERRSRGWPELHITGWSVMPRYDSATHRLEWAIDAQSEGQPVTNFNTRILGRRGVTSVTLVQEPAKLEETVTEFKKVLTGYTFNEGERYAEFKPGDKVAAYGLAALVAGGAAAAAAKTGLLKGLWKFLAVGAVALLASVKSLFKRFTKPSAA